MKIWASMLVVLALSLAGWASQNSTSDNSSSQASQSSQSGQSSQPQQNTPSTSGQASTSSGNQSMSGTVSKDAKSFTNDASSRSYTVDNPDALQGHEGDHVQILVHVDPDTGAIHVVQLVPQK